MGIYSNGTVFGIKMYFVTNEDEVTNVFEKIYETQMTEEQKHEVGIFHTNLQEQVKEKIKFQYYTETWSTYDMNNKTLLKMWLPMQYTDFLQHFLIF
jgi:hypothetical protein